VGQINSGTSIAIYLVDSGIDITHEEFSSANIINTYSYNNTFYDEDGHGTGVASILVGKTLGIVPNVILKNVKIAIKGDCTFGHMMEAFSSIMHDTTNTVSVVNCSWAVPRHTVIDDKIAELDPTKFIVIAAAGNEMKPASTFSPVNMKNVVGVGVCDNEHRVRSWNEFRGSNWGPEVDVTARGIDVNVAVLGGGITPASGTSLAAALVSGVTVQYIQQFPEKNALEIKEVLLKSAIPNILIRDEKLYGSTPNLLIQ